MKSATKVEAERQLAVVREGAAQLYGEEDLRSRLEQALEEGRSLRVKLGLDPSAPDLHLGHALPLARLRRFQELGHTPIFLVGDFTARIGDPSGRKKTRPALSAEEVKSNAATYVEQAGRLLDVERAEVRFNSEWMEAMGPAEFVRLCSCTTVARLLERDDFHKRYKAGEPIAVHEFLYPFVQAYDSVALRADVELGGTDQTFNLLMAREVQRDYGQPPQAVLVNPLLVGTDGRDKMSKSLGNTVGVIEAPEDAYGKIMSISDALMADWAALLEVDLGPAGSDPLARKQRLAAVLVERLHGAEAATRAAAHFQSVVQHKQVPDDLTDTPVPLEGAPELGLLDLLRRLGLTRSNSEGRRLVTQGGVQVDGRGVGDPTLRLAAGRYLIQVGKRRFVRAVLG